MTDPLVGLNEQQQAVVRATDGPVLVLAGAGSGKTRALTHRIAYLLQQRRARPEQILAVTFTNKAAREMKERVLALTGHAAGHGLTLGTFHALGARLLREQHQHTTRSRTFTILDTSDSERVIKQALDQLSLSAREWSPKSLRHDISRAKNELQTPAELAASGHHPRLEIAAQVYTRYQQLLQGLDSFDFDDLILEPLRLLLAHPPLAAHYQTRWQYLSVDEYQDTNPPQDQLLRQLLGPHHNLCAVGDDYQAIYSWRGARVDHILQFAHSFPTCTTLYLTQNYRSTPRILQCANAVIQHNHAQLHKELWTTTTGGSAVQVVTTPSDRAEAAFVRTQITQHLHRGGRARDIVILYRTNAQSRLFEEELIRHRLPYTIIGGIRFYARAEVKDALALLQLAANPAAYLALQRLTQTLIPGVGPKALARVAAYASEHQLPLLEATVCLTPRQQAAFAPLRRVYTTLAQHPPATVTDIVSFLLTGSGYRAELKKQPDAAERQENIDELLSVTADHTDLTRFLEEVALLTDLDTTPTATDRVTCMTLHAAKGLEFNRVFVVGCEEGLLPHLNSLESNATLEEERRLLYVGVTRAREQLTLTHAHVRTLHGETHPQLPSRFLETLPPDVERVDLSDQLPAGLSLTTTPVPTSNEPVYTSFDIGDFVTHTTFGRGVVIQITGSVTTCIFEGYGVKTIESQQLAV